MSDGTLLTDATIGSLEHVAVSRQLVQRGRRIEGTVDIWPVTDESLVVQVVDEFPDDIPVERVWFDPETEPQGGTITSNRASITQVVEGEPVSIEYVVKLSAAVEPVEVDPPTVREVEGTAFTQSGEGRASDAVDGADEADVADGAGGRSAAPFTSGTDTDVDESRAAEAATATDGGGGQFDWVGTPGGAGTGEESESGDDWGDDAAESGGDAFEFGAVVERGGEADG